MAEVTRHLVIDGSNIATEGRSLPSLAQLDEAVRALVKERPFETWTVVVDATFGHRIDSSEKRTFEEALAANELVTPPAGTIGRGDKFLLEIADRSGAVVFSNDSFQEFHGEYDWLFDEDRLIGGKLVPEVGWIFTERTPVRGPKSRMSTRGGGDRRGRLSASGRSGGSRRVLSSSGTGPLPVPTKPPPRPRREPVRAAASASMESSIPEPAGERITSAAPRRRSSSSVSPQAVNDPLPFIEFIAEHGPGHEVEGEVLTFTSHGAFVQVGGVRCYLALKFMGNPAPRSARELLDRGEVRSFVVQAIDAPRRGIDLALPGFEEIDGERVAAPASLSEAGQEAVPTAPPTRRSRKRQVVAAAVPTGAVSDEATVPAGDPVVEDRPSRKRRANLQASDRAPSELGDPAIDGGIGEGERLTVAKKRTSRKRGAALASVLPATVSQPNDEVAGSEAGPEVPSKEAPAKKAPAKKAAAKKAAAKKAAAKRAPEKKAAAKKAAAKKAAARKAVAKKAAARKAPAKKAVAKKAPAKKATAEKATAKKAAEDAAAGVAPPPLETDPEGVDRG